MSSQPSADSGAERRERQQAAVAELGLEALRGRRFEELLNEACARVAETLGVEYAKVLELHPNGEQLLVRAGYGWQSELLGQLEVETDLDSHAGYTLRRNGPVIVENLRDETRFAAAPMLRHAVMSGVTAIIEGRDLRYGVIEADAKGSRRFTDDDINFLQAVANLLGSAVERQRHDEQRAYLGDINTILGGSLEYEETLGRVAQLAVPTLGDWCGVFVTDEAGLVSNVSIAHADPERAPIARALEARYPADRSAPRTVARIIESRQCELYPRISEQFLAEVARDPEHLEILRSMGLHSAMLVPLVNRQQSLGAILLASAESERRYSMADLAFAEQIAARASLAIENARLYRQAQLAGRQREEFVSFASHELRTPLTSILGFASRLARQARREDTPFDEASRESIETLVTEAESMRTTLEMFLEMAQLESDHFTLEVEPIDLQRLLSGEAAALLRRHPRATIEEQYPEERAIITSDELRIRRVIENLLTNAAKYAGSGPEITLRLRFEADRVAIDVQDNGPGIPEDEQSRLFDRFFRGRSHPRAGSGLGLYISRLIADRLDATLTFESVPDRGTTFTLSLPRSIEEGGGLDET